MILIVAMLAVWRATTMLQEEHGPAGIFARFRAFIASKSRGMPGSFYDGYTCFYCLSMWVALLPALYVEHDPSRFFNFLMYWLAISAGAIFLNAAVNKLEQ